MPRDTAHFLRGDRQRATISGRRSTRGGACPFFHPARRRDAALDNRRRMNREYHKWYSPHVEHDMEFLLFGHAGRPILVFPTSMGRFYQYEDFKMIETLAWRLEAGDIQIVCVDSIDSESWYNRNVPVWQRADRHAAYEGYLIQELLPWFADRNPGVRDNLVVTGASFGAYHSVNFAFRHPDLVRKIVAMSGAYSLRFLIHGNWDQGGY